MSTKQRVTFPGFNTRESRDNYTMEVEVGTLMVDGEEYTIEMMRSMKVLDRGEFLPAKIFLNGKKLWGFKDETFTGQVHLVMVKNLPTLCYFLPPGRILEKVMPIADLNRMKKERLGNNIIKIIYPRSVDEIIALKQDAASVLRAFCWFTPQERLAIASFPLRRRQQELNAKNERIRSDSAKRAREKSAREEERRKSLNKHLARVNEILGRVKTFCFKADGKPIVGIPVMGDEWQCLPNNTFVIRVTSYDKATQKYTGPRDGFYVEKSDGGRVSSRNTVAVVAEKPTVHTQLKISAPVPLQPIFIETIGGGKKLRQEVLVFRIIDDVRTVRQMKLFTQDTLITSLDRKQKDGRFEVYTIGGKTIGLCKPLE